MQGRCAVEGCSNAASLGESFPLHTVPVSLSQQHLSISEKDERSGPFSMQWSQIKSGSHWGVVRSWVFCYCKTQEMFTVCTLFAHFLWKAWNLPKADKTFWWATSNLTILFKQSAYHKPLNPRPGFQPDSCLIILSMAKALVQEKVPRAQRFLTAKSCLPST